MLESGERLLLNLRVVGEPLDIMEAPYAFDIKDGVVLLYGEPDSYTKISGGLGLPYAGYNLDLVERFEIVSGEDAEDVEHKINQARAGTTVDLDNGDPAENPFQGGKLKFKEDAA